MSEKPCSKCGIIKPIDKFSPSKQLKSGFESQCRSCRSLSKKLAYRANPLKHKRFSLFKTYGITLNDYQNLLKSQDSRCAICSMHLSESRTQLCVDHSHKTGKIRGLLCHSCNRGIGLLKDNPAVLKRALTYVESRG